MIIKGLTLLLKGFPLEMDAWLKQRFDLSPCLLEAGCDKRSHLKSLGKEVIKGCVCHSPVLSDSSSTQPPEGHSVTQQIRSNCSILLSTSARVQITPITPGVCGKGKKEQLYCIATLPELGTIVPSAHPQGALMAVMPLSAAFCLLRR